MSFVKVTTESSYEIYENKVYQLTQNNKYMPLKECPKHIRKILDKFNHCIINYGPFNIMVFSWTDSTYTDMIVHLWLSQTPDEPVSDSLLGLSGVETTNIIRDIKITTIPDIYKRLTTVSKSIWPWKGVYA